MTELNRRLILLWDEEDVPAPDWYAEQLLSKATQEYKQSLIAEYIRTSEGRERLAAAMTQPIRRRVDYTAVGRRTFLVEPLPDGALPFYDRQTEAATR